MLRLLHTSVYIRQTLYFYVKAFVFCLYKWMNTSSLVLLLHSVTHVLCQSEIRKLLILFIWRQVFFRNVDEHVNYYAAL